MPKFAIICIASIAGAIATPILSSAAAAAEFKGGGSVTYATATEEIIKLSETRNLNRFHLKGVIVADDPKIPIHLSTQDCMGSVLETAEGKPISSTGSCDAIDKDGDIWWLTWTGGADSTSNWRVTGGGGKYQGMTGQGKSEWLVQMAEGRSVLRWNGNFKMK
jgi:hypothetical protein